LSEVWLLNFLRIGYPPVSSNVAGWKILYAGRFIVGNIIYKWGVSDCYSWLPEGTSPTLMVDPVLTYCTTLDFCSCCWGDNPPCCCMSYGWLYYMTLHVKHMVDFFTVKNPIQIMTEIKICQGFPESRRKSSWYPHGSYIPSGNSR
jgi:hypothetical protein